MFKFISLQETLQIYLSLILILTLISQQLLWKVKILWNEYKTKYFFLVSSVILFLVIPLSDFSNSWLPLWLRSCMYHDSSSTRMTYLKISIPGLRQKIKWVSVLCTVGKNCCFNNSRVDFYLEYEPHPSSSKNLRHLFQSILLFSLFLLKQLLS